MAGHLRHCLPWTVVWGVFMGHQAEKLPCQGAVVVRDLSRVMLQPNDRPVGQVHLICKTNLRPSCRDAQLLEFQPSHNFPDLTPAIQSWTSWGTFLDPSMISRLSTSRRAT